MRSVKSTLFRHILFGLLVIGMNRCVGSDVIVTYPDERWEHRDPAEMGLDPNKLDRIATMLGSSGCIVKDGYLVKTWGSIDKRHDWYSSAKPIFSTSLFFAIDEGWISSIDEKISKWGWPLKGKDEAITFRHLANMTSGYMQPEKPSEAFAHNDFAVALMIRTLEKVFNQSIGEAARQRIYKPIGMQDAPYHQVKTKDWKTHGRAWISARDWARLSWFWMNQGNWNGKQLLDPEFVKQATRNQVPVEINSTLAGRYGLYWWTNGVMANGRRPIPSAPEKTYMARGGGGNYIIVVPEWNMVIVRLSTTSPDGDTRKGGIQEKLWDAFFSRLEKAVTE